MMIEDDIMNLVFEDPVIFPVLVGILGLIIGSFLNVLIYRLPKIIMENNETFLSLSKPRSHCPSCRTTLSWWDNIPVLSYCFLRGKCRSCHCRISFYYPLIELLCAVTGVSAALYYGCSLMLFSTLYLIWSLIALTCIDIQEKLLPDLLTQPLLWVGLLISMQGVTISPDQAIYGAVLGYMILWVVYQGFKILTRQEGMGYGDFKLSAALGAWCGWQFVLVIISIASLLGSIWGLYLIFFAGKTRKTIVPFGPFLSVAGLIVFFFGQTLQKFLFYTLPAYLAF